MKSDFPSIETRFRAVLAASMELSPERFASPGTLVVPATDREGSAVVVFYRIGELTVAWCDPAVADHLADVSHPSESFSIEEVEAWAGQQGAEFVGGAWSHLAAADMLTQPQPPSGFDVRALYREDAADRSLIQGLI